MKISPVKSYKAPAYPTRTDVQSNHDLLKHELPKSWINKKIIAGALAAYLFCSCKGESGKQSNIKTEILPGSERNNNKLNTEKPLNESVYVAPLFLHGEGKGGQGAWGCIVTNPPVYLSEEDARYIIEEELMKEGIVFDRKNVTIEKIVFPTKSEDDFFASEDEKELVKKKEDRLIDDWSNWSHIKKSDTLFVDGYSSLFNLAYEYISSDEYGKICRSSSNSSVQVFSTVEASEILRDRLKKYGKLNAVVFYDPLTSMYDEEEKDSWRRLSEEKDLYNLKLIENEITHGDNLYNMDVTVKGEEFYDFNTHRVQSTNKSREQLKKQVHDFVAWIKKEGYLKKDKS